MQRGIAADHLERASADCFANSDRDATMGMIESVVPIIAGDDTAGFDFTLQHFELLDRAIIGVRRIQIDPVEMVVGKLL